MEPADVGVSVDCDEVGCAVVVDALDVTDVVVVDSTGDVTAEVVVGSEVEDDDVSAVEVSADADDADVAVGVVVVSETDGSCDEVCDDDSLD